MTRNELLGPVHDAERRSDQNGAADLDRDRVTLFAIATLVLRRRRTIAWWTVIIAALAVAPVVNKKKSYAASASFIPQTSDARSGLASLAGQFGVTLPGTNQSQSSDFYAALVESRSQLRLIVRDTFTVPELGGRRVAFADLFEINPGSPAKREEDAIYTLEDIASVSVRKPTGIIDVTVVTPWPSVSYTIARALLRNVEDFNRRTRQSQASAERRFLEGRLATSRQELADAEDRLAQFYARNKTIQGSSELTLERDRLQRQVQLQQQVFTSLTQAFEDARIREVRDTPVITIVDPPVLPEFALPRGRLRRGILGLLLGAFLGIAWVVMRHVVELRRQAGDPDADALAGALSEAGAVAMRPVNRARALLGSSRTAPGRADQPLTNARS